MLLSLIRLNKKDNYPIIIRLKKYMKIISKLEINYNLIFFIDIMAFLHHLQYNDIFQPVVCY